MDSIGANKTGFSCAIYRSSTSRAFSIIPEEIGVESFASNIKPGSAVAEISVNLELLLSAIAQFEGKPVIQASLLSHKYKHTIDEVIIGQL